MLRRLSQFFTSLVAGLLWVGSASADPSAADRATARALAGEGYQALQHKDYPSAVDRFSRADALVHAPTLMLDWARSLAGLGQLVEAQERYQQVLREGVDPKAPKSWQHALLDAKSELAALEPRLSWVTIKVSGSSDAHVTIDGAPVPAAALGVRRAINPGVRKLEVTSKGYIGKHQTVRLGEGEETAVSFELELDPDQQAAPAAVIAPQRAAEPPPPAHSRAPIFVALGVAGAGFVVGGVTGILALNKRSTLVKHCPDHDNCPSDDADNVHAYHSLGTASGIGFGVGIAGLATGVTLWLLDRKPEAAPVSGLVVRPYLGLGTVGAWGSF